MLSSFSEVLLATRLLPAHPASSSPHLPASKGTVRLSSSHPFILLGVFCWHSRWYSDTAYWIIYTATVNALDIFKQAAFRISQLSGHSLCVIEFESTRQKLSCLVAICLTKCFM